MRSRSTCPPASFANASARRMSRSSRRARDGVLGGRICGSSDGAVAPQVLQVARPPFRAHPHRTPRLGTVPGQDRLHAARRGPGRARCVRRQVSRQTSPLFSPSTARSGRASTPRQTVERPGATDSPDRVERDGLQGLQLAERRNRFRSYQRLPGSANVNMVSESKSGVIEPRTDPTVDVENALPDVTKRLTKRFEGQVPAKSSRPYAAAPTAGRVPASWSSSRSSPELAASSSWPARPLKPPEAA